jgi:hypothetical protein
LFLRNGEIDEIFAPSRTVESDRLGIFTVSEGGPVPRDITIYLGHRVETDFIRLPDGKRRKPHDHAK